MVNDHIEARLWAEHGAEFNQSIANGLARLACAIRRAGALAKSRSVLVVPDVAK